LEKPENTEIATGTPPSLATLEAGAATGDIARFFTARFDIALDGWSENADASPNECGGLGILRSDDGPTDGADTQIDAKDVVLR